MQHSFVFKLLVSCVLTLGHASKDLVEKLENLEKKFSYMEHRMKSMEMELESCHKNSSSNALGRLSKRLAATGVAFHAYQSQTTCQGNLQLIRYDTVEINQGGGYNTADGIFDAPVSGLNLFSWTTATMEDDWLVTELIINGWRKGIIGTDSNGRDIMPGTAVVLAHVNAGEHVFVRRVKGDGCPTDRLLQEVRKTFTGILLS